MSFRWAADEGQTLAAGDAALEYRCYGPPPGSTPTLVLLHEGLGSVDLWRDVPRKIAEATGLGVLAYSRQGHGRSSQASLPRPLNYMTQEAEDTLGKVLDAAGITATILLGHSDGATIAGIYAGSVSDMRVRGLILIAPHFFTEPIGLSAIRAAGKDFDASDLRAKLSRYHDDADALFRGWHDVWVHPEFETWNVADAIDHWRIPVLALQGTDDPYGSLAQIDEIETRVYSPLERVILRDCGHAPHLERPEETKRAIVAFCARLVRLEQEDVLLS
ncbi:alpha/beta fold hydrolase [Roseobacter sp. EG26]|uniref:alpha/beta fold hydrolase n=1 Tax=Roseobacter sp. EG26 TaxID=3412477 RepID=UPI003CE52541